MAFRFHEKPNSRDSSTEPLSVTRRYLAAGSSDDDFVRNYATWATPHIISTSLGTLYRQNITLVPEASDQFEVVVPYARRKRDTGSYTLTFDTTGGTATIKASYETVGSYKAAGDADDIPDHKGAINVQEGKAEGTEIVIPTLKLNVSFRHPLGVITPAQIKNLARLTGKVNSEPFLGFDPGEILFLGCTGSEGTDAETEIHYQFAASENLQNEIIGGIEVASKDGWDVAWIEFADDEDAGQPIRKPKFIRVERVYRRTDLAMALGFGG